MREIQIDVTAQDIAEGMPRQPTRCALALAGARAFRGPVSVVGWGIYAGDLAALLPREAQHFVSDYDKGRPVQPFSFTLHLLDEF